VNDLKKTANMVYLPYWENPRWRLFFLVRSSLPASALADSIRGVMWNADPQVAIPVLKPLDALVDDSVATDRFQTLLLSSFGIAALCWRCSASMACWPIPCRCANRNLASA
jgi:hypothetical protein